MQVAGRSYRLNKNPMLIVYALRPSKSPIFIVSGVLS